MIPTEAPPIEAAEEALRQATSIVAFSYTVAYVPIDRIFKSRHVARKGKKATRQLTFRAAQAPESLPPIVLLRSKTHPGHFAVAWGVDIFNAARMPHLPGLWAVVADQWVEVFS